MQQPEGGISEKWLCFWGFDLEEIFRENLHSQKSQTAKQCDSLGVELSATDYSTGSRVCWRGWQQEGKNSPPPLVQQRGCPHVQCVSPFTSLPKFGANPELLCVCSHRRSAGASGSPARSRHLKCISVLTQQTKRTQWWHLRWARQVSSFVYMWTISSSGGVQRQEAVKRGTTGSKLSVFTFWPTCMNLVFDNLLNMSQSVCIMCVCVTVGPQQQQPEGTGTGTGTAHEQMSQQT